MMSSQGLAVQVEGDGHHLVPPSVDVLQPQQETVARLVELLRPSRSEEQRQNAGEHRRSNIYRLHDSFCYLALHQRPLKLLPPVLQGAAQSTKAGVHLLQAVTQLPRLLRLRVRLEEVGAPQVDGQDLGLVAVQALLKLLDSNMEKLLKKKVKAVHHERKILVSLFCFFDRTSAAVENMW